MLQGSVTFREYLWGEDAISGGGCGETGGGRSPASGAPESYHGLVGEHGQQRSGRADHREQFRVAITTLLLNYRRFVSIDGGFASVKHRLDSLQADMKDLNKAMTALEIDVGLVKDEIGL
ncbi:MAG TPA: hypothetical protein VK789_03650 [Bryobacteraceae bacterium]|jgi:hypothetical protein|nr:hypothetical protein [Bryobacteraceae bacterium]